MAMTIRNDSSSMMALGQMKKNDSSRNQQLQKVASGMRINSAGDDASGYSISERMRVMIRSLGQDIQNTQTGRNLVATAEGGMQEIINNLRSMKELAINSANDHNTDLDRETLEKEFSSRMESITEITATTNYNGRLLLTGDYAQYRLDTSGSGGSGQNTLISGFQPAFNTCASDNRIISGGRTGVPVDSSYVGSGNGNWNYWVGQGQLRPPNSAQRKQIAVAMDFSNLSVNYPSALDGKGFAILCGECSQYINFIFDASTTSSSYTTSPTPPAGQLVNGFARAYTVGIQNVTNATDLAQAVFNAVKSAQGQMPIKQYVTSNTFDTTSSNLLIDELHYLRLAEINGSYYFLKNDDKCPLQFINGIYGEPRNEFESTDLVIGDPLIIHTGPKANQNLRVFINAMWPKDMGIENAHVTPLEAALVAMGLLDHAVDYALNEITRMGAYQMRLNQTESNLVTGEENTESAESLIRDADMAKEMTGYIKSNVLNQSAQAMLAQANKNSGNVLKLLQ
ncbi:flagellin C-terminal helical region [Selenomonas ruminantium]|uniref:Flagellin n=1 Tax=Selenomonas ruminantium TaxID=971 RepID=A0A1M6VRW6_SELRU|nr:flagellin [Selenomonas ruminantium]SHK84095.1 flagellin C-terminal helical region [Selenomonas ruminantium]